MYIGWYWIFPEPGIIFRDITSVLYDGMVLQLEQRPMDQSMDIEGRDHGEQSPGGFILKLIVSMGSSQTIWNDSKR